MQEEFVSVNGTPTHVAMCGIARKEDIKNCEELVFLIPGNPGLIGYYTEFLDTLYNCCRIPVCAVSHAGHEQSSDDISSDTSKQTYNLDFQIQHKIAFIKEYIPNHVRLYIIGHSIGCKIILDILKIKEIDQRVIKCYLLFPTIERMAETPNGRILTKFVLPITRLILFLSWIFTLFPTMLQRGLVYSYFLVRGSGTSAVDVTRQLINPNVLRNVFFLGHDEMIKVKELDHCILDTHKEKIFLYYGTTDNWTPITYFEELLKSHPNINAQLCNNNFEHAFVLSSAKEMGLCVSEMIKSDRSINAKID